MTAATLLAWTGYLAWLAAGSADFACHRATGLARTSGWRESALHLAQIALVASSVLLWLLFEPGRGLALLVGVLLLAHAGVGYADTRVAWAARRDIRPFEQHVHSVLDLAPWIAYGLAFFLPPREPGWGLALRAPALPVSLWLAVLVPALLLVALPALLEFGRAWATRGVRQQQSRAEGGIGREHPQRSDLPLEAGAEPARHHVVIDDIGQAGDARGA
jgi:hypothetical protein